MRSAHGDRKMNVDSRPQMWMFSSEHGNGKDAFCFIFFSIVTEEEESIASHVHDAAFMCTEGTAAACLSVLPPARACR